MTLPTRDALKIVFLSYMWLPLSSHRCPSSSSIVVTGLHYSQHVYVRPVMQLLPNVTLELSRYEALCGVEKLVNEFGPHRFVYGSGYPEYAMGPVLFALHHVVLCDEDLAAICNDNLQRLLMPEDGS